jgi:renalase
MDSLQPWYGEAGRIRHRSAEGMNQFVRALASGLDIRKETRVTRLVRDGGGWRALTDTGGDILARHVLCALPVPQALDLFDPETLPATAQPLRKVRYHRCLTLLAELDAPGGLPAPGHVCPASGILRSLTDNHAKGISAAPTLTAHATPAFSLEWYERDRATAAAVLRAAAQEHIAARITAAQIHGWKFAEAAERLPMPCLLAEPGLCFAGDGFQSDDDPALPPRIESALLSGLAAARALAP